MKLLILEENYLFKGLYFFITVLILSLPNLSSSILLYNMLAKALPCFFTLQCFIQ